LRALNPQETGAILDLTFGLRLNAYRNRPLGAYGHRPIERKPL
jgi:hypothetical protein